MKHLAIVSLAILLAAAVLPALAASPDKVPRISPQQLQQMLGQPGVKVIDVRLGWEYRASKYKIAGALREDPNQVDKWAAKYDKGHTYVLY